MTAEPPEARVTLLQRLRSADRFVVAVGAAIAALLVVAVIGSLRSGGPEGPAAPAPAAVSISPSGAEVGRLTPVVVAFPEPPATTDAAALLRLEPAVGGAYAWLDDRTLLFQPDFPGYQRGAEYVAHVDGAAAGVEASAEQRFTVEGELRVDYVVPAAGDVELPLNAQIYVQFSRSVAPLTTLAARGDAPVLEFSPPLPGSGEWLNTSLYRYTPAELAPSTSYEVRVPAGLTSAVDGVLAADFTWSFATIQPALATSDPGGNTQFVGLRRPVVLTFNQPMGRAAVEAGVRIEATTGPALAGAWGWSDGDRVATFTPAAPYDLDTRYEVTVPAGLPGAAGGETPAERSFDFRTSALPAVSSSDPRPGSNSAGRYGISLTFSNPMDVESVEDRLTLSGFDPRDYELFAWDEQNFFVSVELQPSSPYELRIADGAVDRDGLALGPYTLSFRTGALPPSVAFAVPWQISTYDAGTEQILYFHAVNLPGVDFDLYDLTRGELDTLIRNGGYPPYTGIRPWRPDRAPLRSWEEALEGDQNILSVSSTSLGDGASLPPGDYYLISESGEGAAILTFAVVDSVLVTKLSFDELLVWALDHDTGAPLANVTVEVNGPRLSDATATTGAAGLASFAVPGPREVANEQRTYTVRLAGSGRRGLAVTDWQGNAAPWQLNLPIEWWPREYVGHLYSDRPIYRPGETVFYKGVVREDDDARYRLPGDEVQLSAVVRDAQYSEVARVPVSLNDFGTFAAELELPEGASIGGWGIDLYEGAGNDQEWITSTSFVVAEFRRPEFEVSVEAARADYLDGETIDGTAAATFYFGGPVGAADVTWAALASPAGIFFEGYEDYAFTDTDSFRVAEIRDPLRAEGRGVTGADGRLAINVPAALRGNEGPQTFQLSVSVGDDSQQVVAGSATATVHPAAYYAGIRSDSSIATAGEPTSIFLVTLDVTGQPVPARDVTVEVFERRWITTKEETADGRRVYRSEPQDTLVATLPATTNAAAQATIEHTPERPGTLRLVASTSDDAGRVAKSSTFLWVSGAGQASWQFRNDDIIELIADRELYEVGDRAEVLVPVPFPGATGLVTIERGRILEQSTRRFASGSETLSIPIDDAHLPNAFVGVVLYRPPTATDPIPRYHVGYAHLRVSAEPRRLDVSVTPDRDRAAPGERVRYDIDVRDAQGRGAVAEVSLAIVDRAVLALADEVGPDGLRAFWFERGLGVQTGSSLAVSIDRANDVISLPPGSGKGGGARERLRQDFRNTALWEAQLVTDAAGHASVELKLPDNLTTWRAQARAVSGDTQVGEATSELLVTEPLLLRPALPRFLRVGDSTRLRTLVRNGTTEPLDVQVGAEATGVELEQTDVQTRRIEPDASAVFEWPARVSAEGSARVTFRADGGEHTDAVVLELPVYLDVTPETTATGGVVTGEAAAEAVYLPDFALAEPGSLEVSVQASLVGLLDAELSDFRPVPRETVEAVASRLVATLAADRATGEATRATSVRNDIAKLVSLRRPGGGWGWCERCSVSEPITAWVLTALGDAADAGYFVDAGVTGGSSGLLLRAVTGASDVEDPAAPSLHASYLYAIAHVDTARLATPGPGGAGDDPPPRSVRELLRAVYEQDRTRLASWGRAYLVLGLLDAGEPADSPVIRGLLNDLTAATEASANGNHWEDEDRRGVLQSTVRTTALVLQALAAADPNHPLIDQTVRWLVLARSAEQWHTTIERAQGLSALGSYAALTGELAADYDYALRLDNRELLAGAFTRETAAEQARVEVPLADLPRGAVSLLSFVREAGPGRLYYAMNLRYSTPAQQIEALNRGFAVSHEYSLLDAPDRSVEAVPAGELVRVRVTVVAPAERRFVVVDDLLPAGLEPIDPLLNIVPTEVRLQLEQERQEAFLEAAPVYFALWWGWYFSPWDQVDTRDDRVTLYADTLPQGIHEFIYYARATTPGDYFVAPAHAEERFLPEVFGRSDSSRLTVQ